MRSLVQAGVGIVLLLRITSVGGHRRLFLRPQSLAFLPQLHRQDGDVDSASVGHQRSRHALLNIRGGNSDSNDGTKESESKDSSNNNDKDSHDKDDDDDSTSNDNPGFAPLGGLFRMNGDAKEAALLASAETRTNGDDGEDDLEPLNPGNGRGGALVVAKKPSNEAKAMRITPSAVATESVEKADPVSDGAIGQGRSNDHRTEAKEQSKNDRAKIWWVEARREMNDVVVIPDGPSTNETIAGTSGNMSAEGSTTDEVVSTDGTNSTDPKADVSAADESLPANIETPDNEKRKRENDAKAERQRNNNKKKKKHHNNKKDEDNRNDSKIKNTAVRIDQQEVVAKGKGKTKLQKDKKHLADAEGTVSSPSRTQLSDSSVNAEVVRQRSELSEGSQSTTYVDSIRSENNTTHEIGLNVSTTLPTEQGSEFVSSGGVSTQHDVLERTICAVG